MLVSSEVLLRCQATIAIVIALTSNVNGQRRVRQLFSFRPLLMKLSQLRSCPPPRPIRVKYTPVQTPVRGETPGVVRPLLQTRGHPTTTTSWPPLKTTLMHLRRAGRLDPQRE
ncbi:hypothetical protein C2E23DRAFT_822172 [Lenzites betulinus]|nr:hypothetical protein C2E23DRAFT_822172 [Lenzites betulinus]